MLNSQDNSISEFAFVSQHFHFSLLAETDRDFYQSLYTDKTVMEKIAEPLGLHSLSALFQHVLKHNNLGLIGKSKSLCWIIRDLSTYQILGIQGFMQNLSNPFDAEFGIMLSIGNHRKGIANESISALIKYGFSEMEFNKLYANYTTQNNAIQRIAKNLNFNISIGQNQPNSKYCWLTKQQFISRLPLVKRYQNATR